MDTLLIVGIIIAAIAVIILLALVGKFFSLCSGPCSPGQT